MVGIILIIVGLIFIGAGIFAGNTFGSFMGSAPDVAQDALGLGQTVFLVAFIGVGALLVLFGVIALVRSGRRRQMTQRVLQEGVSAEAKITYIDKNYRVLVNNRPIYSIVEYTFVDGLGNQYVNRVDNVNSESLIRSGWQVGSVIPIKYNRDNPQQSAIAPQKSVISAV